MSREIKVERCEHCPMKRGGVSTFYWCMAKDGRRIFTFDRRFPKWCPLKQGDVIIRMEK